MKKILSLALFLLGAGTCLWAQGAIQQKWVVGRSCNGGGAILDFATTPPSVTPACLAFGGIAGILGYADEDGQLRFYSNGCLIADALGNIMQEGDSLGLDTANGCLTLNPNNGIDGPQWGLALPRPASGGRVFLFHQNVTASDSVCKALLFSEIDLGANGGLGAVAQRNVLLTTDSLSPSQLTACKHANGRDWWLLQPRYPDNTYLRYLVTPWGVEGPFYQQIGPAVPHGGGWRSQASFSPDGERYARNAHTPGGLLFRFDRCTGLLYDPLVLEADWSTPFIAADNAACFSPSSRFLYLGTEADLFQFDLHAPDPQASRVLVGQYDFWQDGVSYPCLGMLQPGPDGKMYMGTSCTARYLHVVNSPDSAGLACNFVQRQIQLPSWRRSGPNNLLNYALGALPGSPCDSLGLGTGATEISDNEEITVFPNPADQEVTVRFRQPFIGVIELYNAQGILCQSFPSASEGVLISLDISALPAGLYFLCAKDERGKTFGTKRIATVK